jgi:hypothetical protein
MIVQDGVLFFGKIVQNDDVNKIYPKKWTIVVSWIMCVTIKKLKNPWFGAQE